MEAFKAGKKAYKACKAWKACKTWKTSKAYVRNYLKHLEYMWSHELPTLQTYNKIIKALYSNNHQQYIRVWIKTQFTILMRGLSFEMRRRPSYLYMNKDKQVIIVDPLFPHLIPSNPPQYHG